MYNLTYIAIRKRVFVIGTMSKKIEMLLIELDIPKKELSSRLGTTQSNLSAKLRRDNFSEKELQDIATACGVTFKGSFIIDDTGKEI